MCMGFITIIVIGRRVLVIQLQYTEDDIVVGMPEWKRQVSETDSNGEYQYVNFYGATYLYNSEQLMADIPIIGNI